MLHDYILDESGHYCFSQSVPENRLLKLAAHILEGRAKLPKGELISATEQAGEFLSLKLSGQEREVFAVLFLTTRHTLICYEELFFGTIDGASVHPREVVKRALVLNAAAVIIGHNHPSGDATPSQADKQITVRLKEAFALVDIRLLDHFVVSSRGYESFAGSGFI